MNAMKRSHGTVQDIRERIAEWCAWFDLAPPKLRVRKDSVYMNDELWQWLRNSGTSFDWVFCGDARSMAHIFRQRELETMKFNELLSGFDATEQDLMLEALKAHRSGKITFDEAIAKFQTDIAAYRADRSEMTAMEH